MSCPLARYPHPRIRIECGPCGRRGDYSVARLVARYGPDMRLPDLLAKLSADCPGRRGVTPRCDAVFARESRVDPAPHRAPEPGREKRSL